MLLVVLFFPGSITGGYVSCASCLFNIAASALNLYNL